MDCPKCRRRRKTASAPEYGLCGLRWFQFELAAILAHWIAGKKMQKCRGKIEVGNTEERFGCETNGTRGKVVPFFDCLCRIKTNSFD
jgi:hypothetical protein